MLIYILTIILFFNSYSLLANPTSKPIVHIKSGQVYSMKFDAQTNKQITDWLTNNLKSSVKLPKALAWTPEHRPGNYSDKLFFKSNANYLNMRHLGTFRHKNNTDMAVLYVLPEDNKQLKANFRPTKPFVLLLKPSGMVQGKAPSRTASNKKTSSQIGKINKATGVTVLSSNFKATCIRGDCKGEKSTVQFSDGTQIKGNMNSKVKNSSFEIIYAKGSGSASRFKGAIDYVTLKPIKGKLYYDESDLVLSTGFKNGVTSGPWSMQFNTNITLRGAASNQNGFQGKAIASFTKVPNSLPNQMKTLTITGNYKNNVPVGKHNLSWCKGCGTAFTYDMNKINNVNIMSLYGKNSPLDQLYKSISGLTSYKSDLKKELIKKKLPIIAEWNYTCGNRCTSSKNIPTVQGDDVRVIVVTPLRKGKYKVKINNFGEKMCEITKGICVAQFKKKGSFPSGKVTVKMIQPTTKTPHINSVFIIAHKKRTAPIRKSPPKTTRSYILERDVKEAIAKVMKSRRYSIVRANIVNVDALSEVSITDKNYRQLSGGAYRFFIWGESSPNVCLQWKYQFNKTMSGRKGIMRNSTDEICGKEATLGKLGDGYLHSIGTILPDGLRINSIKVLGVYKRDIRVLIKLH